MCLIKWWLFTCLLTLIQKKTCYYRCQASLIRAPYSQSISHTMFLHRFMLQLKAYILIFVRFQIFVTSQILGPWLSIIFTLKSIYCLFRTVRKSVYTYSYTTLEQQVCRLLQNFDRKNRRDQVPYVSKFLWKDVTLLIVGWFRKNPQHAFLRRGSKAVGPMS